MAALVKAGNPKVPCRHTFSTAPGAFDGSITSIPPEIPRHLDRALDSIEVGQVPEGKARTIRFKGKEEPVTCSAGELKLLLPGGTIRGTNLFTLASGPSRTEDCSWPTTSRPGLMPREIPPGAPD